jgi:uncharacterized UBP type Zn finger protein
MFNKSEKIEPKIEPIKVEPIKVPGKDYTIVKFKGTKTITDNEFNTFLSLLDRYFVNKMKIALLVDASECTYVPVKASFMLSSWMKKNKENIINYMTGSAVVFNSDLVTKLVTMAFKIQKPVKPNLITKNADAAQKFLMSL